MEHQHSDDEFGFWEPDRTRRLPRLRGAEPTRSLAVVRPGSRHHGGSSGDTAFTHDGAAPSTAEPQADTDTDDDDALGLFDELGPADEFPGLDELLGATEVPVVATARRSWWRRLRRDERGRIDPLAARLGIVLLVGAVTLPFAVAANAGGADPTGAVSSGTAVALTAPTVAAPTESSAEAPATTPTAASGAGAASSDAAASAVGSAADAGAAPATVGTTEPGSTEATTIERAQSATAALRRCVSTYEVLAGDYWLGIADRADVDVDDLLAANGADTDTALFAGREICLPAGATTPVPAPATTTATVAPPATTDAPAPSKPATTDAPATTTKAPGTSKAPATTSAPATTKAPATTAKPTTTTAAPTTTTQPPRTYTRAEVAQIIRDVWPDDLEDKAIAIATRESNLQPAVRNACCFGLFQIYFDVHDGWLAAMGVVRATDLYDPLVNAQAALTLYFRSGGWGPWGG